MRRLIVSLLVLAVVSLPVLADEGHHHAAPTATQIGSVNFKTSCSAAVQKDVQRAMALLHSFWYDEAGKSFRAIAAKDPKCAMAHWGVAMSIFHPLWAPPSAAEMTEANAALDRAKATAAKTQRERDYVAALETYFRNAERPAFERLKAYSQAMGELAAKYRNDSEAAIFHALSLIAVGQATVPKDKTYALERQAGAILEPLFVKQPNHPGLAHYIIHAYDNPVLAKQGLNAARNYAKIAPEVPHALHMPSHIFIRLGLWDDAITSNRASADAAAKHLKMTGLPSAWAEQLHALDYLEYAYLQQGDEKNATAVLEEFRATMGDGKKASVIMSGYAVASIPARYAVERRDWKTAAALVPAGNLASTDAITWHAKGLGAARTGDIAGAQKAVEQLAALKQQLETAGDKYWAGQAEIQRLEVLSWLRFAEGDKEKALKKARMAAELEDKTDKHPITPGAITPARELLAEMLLETGDAKAALAEYEAALKLAPNRLVAVSGAMKAAEAAGDKQKAAAYSSQLAELKKSTRAGM